MTRPPLACLPLWIGGRSVASRSARHADVFNPATGAVVRRVPLADAGEVDAAVGAALAAWPDWRAAPPLRRARILMRFRDLMDARKQDLAAIVTEEHGKTLADAEGSVTRGIEVIEFATGIPHLLKGEFSENVGADVDSYSLRQPVGVCAGITPFNFPAMVPLWMFPLALACGNCFVLKPSERDPSLALRMAELLREAGLPDGVFNVVHGDREAVDALLAHPDVRAISFVGSTPVARHIYETGTRHGKRVQALGGAKNHAIVLPDADLDFATEAIIGAAYGSAGERCMAISAVVAVGGDRRRAGAAAGDTRAGGADRTGDATRRRDGAGDHRGGARPHRRPRRPRPGRGRGAGGRRAQPRGRRRRRRFLRRPDAVRPRAAVDDDLPRGDLRPGAGGAARRVARAGDRDRQRQPVRQRRGAVHPLGPRGAAVPGGASTSGCSGINVPIPVPMAFHSFGGWKNSLFGDLHVHGMDGVRFYTRGKVVTARWPDDGSAAPGFQMPLLG